MPSVYEMEHDPEVAEVLEAMRQKLSQVFGVTVTGNRCTIRWTMHDQLVDVHMIVENVTTPVEAEQARERSDRMEALFKKYPNLREELYHADTGEWIK